MSALKPKAMNNKYDKMIDTRYNRIQSVDCPIKKQKIRDEIKALQQKSFTHNYELETKRNPVIASKIAKLKRFKAIHFANMGGFEYSQEVEAEILDGNCISFYGARGFKESILLENLGSIWQIENKNTLISNHSRLQILNFSI